MSKRKPSKEKMQAYAKLQYMLPGKRGKHKYSCQIIADKIEQKFGVRYTRASILHWTKKIDEDGSSWESEYQASIAMGITSARIKNAEKDGKSPEEAYQEQVVRDSRERYKSTEKTHNYQEQIIQAMYASAIGSIAKLAKDMYDNKIAKIPLEELLDIIPPALLKTIMESEKDMDGRLQEMRNSAVNKSQIGQEKIKLYSELSSEELRRLILGKNAE